MRAMKIRVQKTAGGVYNAHDLLLSQRKRRGGQTGEAQDARFLSLVSNVWHRGAFHGRLYFHGGKEKREEREGKKNDLEH